MIDITIFDNIKDCHGENHSFTFEQLQRFFKENYTLQDSKKPAQFFGGWFNGAGKEAKNIKHRSLLTYDIDKCLLNEDEIKEFLVSLKDFTYLYYTTKRSTAEDVRFRLIFVLDKNIDKSSYKTVAKNFAYIHLKAIYDSIDKSCYQHSKMFYLPHKSSKNYELTMLSNDGKFINPFDYAVVNENTKADEKLIVKSLRIRPLQLDKNQILEILKNYQSNTTDYNSWLECGMAIHHQFQGSDEGYLVFKNWSLDDPRVGKEWQESEVLKDIKYKYYSQFTLENNNPVTFATILHRIKSNTLKEERIPEKINPADFVHTSINLQNGLLKPLSTLQNFIILMKKYNIIIRFDIAVKDIVNSIDLSPNDFNTSIKSDLILNGMKPELSLNYISYIGNKNIINSWADFILSKHWDGKNRIYDFFTTVQVNGVSNNLRDLYLLTWLKQMLYLNFSKDHIKSPRYVLVFQSNESKGKTAWLRTFAPVDMQKKYIGEGIRLKVGEDFSELRCAKKIFVELGELGGTFKKSDSDAVKMYFGRKYDSLNLKWLTMPVEYKRTTSFFATVNETEFLNQEDEHTRFLILPVTNCNSFHDIDMQQLYAELYETADWENFELTETQRESQISYNDQFKQKPVLEEQFLRFFDVEHEVNKSTSKRYNKTEILEVLGYSNKDITRSRQNDIGYILKKYKLPYRSGEKSWYLQEKSIKF